ncbi:unnamed protein product [marine sediment metagenome]|uniref:Uncharacterized protein n=1 Tax=marine sediment metagenome TaxID=412755 RepID=X1F5Z5_9ZZZZ
MPLIKITTEITVDTATIGPGGVEVFNKAHRNPSTTPTIGFSAYIYRSCSGTSLDGYTMGVI